MVSKVLMCSCEMEDNLLVKIGELLMWIGLWFYSSGSHSLTWKNWTEITSGRLEKIMGLTRPNI